MRSVFDRLGFGLLLAALLITSAELTARLDDYLRRDIPFSAVPDNNFDLLTVDSLGVRGKPGGRYKWWQLNSFGFRGPEMHLQPAPGCVRVMILGASETFGIYESDTKQYPAQLQDSLDRRVGCYEVVNAGLPGLTLRGIIQLWTNWGSRFQPHVVVVYPTPSFYLHDNAPDFRTALKEGELTAPAWYTSRLLLRAQDALTYPKFIRRRRVAKLIAERERGRQPEWFFRSIPEDRLRQFGADLDSLLASISARGAKPILLTHAIRFSRPPHPADRELLDSWRAYTVRPTIDVKLDFEKAARHSVLDLGARRNVLVIDVAAVMSGKREWFGDVHHFTDVGAGIVAGLIADGVVRATRSRNQMSTASNEASGQSN